MTIFNFMNKLLLCLLSYILVIPVMGQDDPLVGSVPEDIYLEMRRQDCSPIPRFYAIDRDFGSGDGRIGSPYADGYARVPSVNVQQPVTIFGCKLDNKINDYEYKIMIMFSDVISTRGYDCHETKASTNSEICGVAIVHIYEKFNVCDYEILLHYKPAGLLVRTLEEVDDAVSLIFSDTFDLGGTGTLYTCVDGKWESESLH